MIRNKTIHLGAMILILWLISAPCIFSEARFLNQEETWSIISNTLKSFLSDPVAYSSEMEKIGDLNYWTIIYEMIENVDYVKELLSRHFQANKMDEFKLNIIFNLLLKYSIPPDPYSSLTAPIIDRIVEVFQNDWSWFIENLRKRSDWKKIVRLIYAKEKDKFKEKLFTTNEQDTTKEILNFLRELEHEKEDEYKLLEKFLKEPDFNIEKIKSVHDWGSIIGQYEMLHQDENKTLWPEYNPMLLLINWIKNGTNEAKIEVLCILIKSLLYGYHGELISDIGAKIFLEHPKMFIESLSKDEYWKTILLRISYDLYFYDRCFEKSINSLGDFGFEKKVKDQLKFLSSILNERLKE